MLSALGLSPDALGSRPVIVLDGGLGTTLQSPPFNVELSSTLWSSQLLDSPTGRQTLADLHLAFLDAGAEILGTCSYQSSLPLFLTTQPPPSLDLALARQTMLSCLSPALSSCRTPRPLARFPPLITLSLGPYGAQLQPAQEYTALYPPPFGPSSPSVLSYDPSLLSPGGLYPLPIDRVRGSGVACEDHLAAWHLQRLEEFSKAEEFEMLGQQGVALVAFETVGLLSEIRAVRRSMAVLNLERKAAGRGEKAFYVSLVFPLDADGVPRLPDAKCAKATKGEMARLIIEACFGGNVEQEEEGGLAGLAGLGINCTSPLHLEEIIIPLSEALDAFVKARQQRRETTERAIQPWLILYPDGGAIYDPLSRTWSTNGIDERLWAGQVVKAVEVALSHKRENGSGSGEGEESTWGGVMAGGCCKAGPGAIRELRNELGKRGLI